MSEPLRVIVYASKSTSDVRASIEDQVRTARAHAATQGWVVDGLPETEDAVSGWSGNRGPKLERAMKRAEALAAKHGDAGLLVWRSNRLARGELLNPDVKHLIDYFRWADRASVKLLSVEDQSTFDNELMVSIIGYLNAEESKAKSQAVRRKRTSARAAGILVGGFIFGYKPDSTVGYVEDPQTAPVVRRIFGLIASGSSQASVARVLTSEGIPTPSGGTRWTQGSLSRMVRSRTYIGEMPIDDPAQRPQDRKHVPLAWGPGKHAAIVDREVWDAAQASNARRANGGGTSGGRPPAAGHLLTGRMLHHAVCGSAMTPRSHTRRKTDGEVAGAYACSGKKNGVCDGLVVPMKTVDDAVLAYLADVGIDAEQTMRLIDESRAAREGAVRASLTTAQRDLSKLEDERARMWGLLRSGALDAEDWNTFKAEHDAEAAGLRAQVAQLEAQVSADADAPAAVPVVADTLALVREFVAKGDRVAVRNVASVLFSDFLIGEAGELPQSGAVDAGTPAQVAAARAGLRARLGAAPQAIERGNADALAEEFDLMPDEPEPAPDVAAEGIELGLLLLLPEPNPDALASVLDAGGPALLVDEHGHPMFRRLPLLGTNPNGLTR